MNKTGKNERNTEMCEERENMDRGSKCVIWWGVEGGDTDCWPMHSSSAGKLEDASTTNWC